MLHVRHALTNKLVSSSAKQQREITTLAFTVLMREFKESFRSDNDYDYDYDYEIRTWEAGTRL